jgi:monoterpene epsilon-lactone hydrolase
MSELDPVIDDINAAFAAFTPDKPLNEMRDLFENLFAYDDPNPLCSRSPIRIGENESEWLVPKGATRDSGTILYIHGGGFVFLSLRSHRALCDRLGHEAGASVLSLNYRLSPEHRFPAALDDAIAAYQWLLDDGRDPSKIAIAGDSAGGNLTLATLLVLKERKIPLPACAIPISPWTDMLLTGETMTTKVDVDPIVRPDDLRKWIEVYAPGMDVRNPLLSPLYGDYEGMPPLLFQVGEREVLVDDSRRLVEKARAVGVEVDYQCWKKQIHVFQIFPHRLTDARVALGACGAFIRRHFASAPSR